MINQLKNKLLNPNMPIGFPRRSILQQSEGEWKN